MSRLRSHHRISKRPNCPHQSLGYKARTTAIRRRYGLRSTANLRAYLRMRASDAICMPRAPSQLFRVGRATICLRLRRGADPIRLEAEFSLKRFGELAERLPEGLTIGPWPIEQPRLTTWIQIASSIHRSFASVVIRPPTRPLAQSIFRLFMRSGLKMGRTAQCPTCAWRGRRAYAASQITQGVPSS
jgi:hypothetical protein